MKHIFTTAYAIVAAISVYGIDVQEFTLTGYDTNRIASLTWASDVDSGYVIEGADEIGGDWMPVDDGDVYSATDFRSTVTVYATNSSHFFRIQEVDVVPPDIHFASPSQDAVAVPVDADIRIDLSDASGINETMMHLYLDGIEADASTISFDGRTLIYTPPDGLLGTNGQQIIIRVLSFDLSGNEAEAFSTIRLERPLTVVASSILFVGDPGLDIYSYEMVDGIKAERPDIVLSGFDENEMTFSGVTESDLLPGRILLSQVSTNIFYRKVVSAETIGNGSVRVETQEVDLSEIVTGSFSSATTECIVYDETGRPIARSGTKKSNRTLLGKAIDTGWIGLPGIDKTLRGSDFSLDLGDFGIAFSEEIYLKVLSAIWIRGDVGIGDDADFEISSQYEVTTRENGSFKFTLGSASKPIKDKIIPLGTFPVSLGGVVWLDIKFSLQAKLEVKGEYGGEVTWGVERHRVTQHHLRYKNKKWETLPESKTDTWEDKLPTTFDAGGAGSFELSAGIRVEVKVDKLVGPYLFVGPYVNGTATYMVNGGYHKKVVAGVKGEVGVALTFFKDKPLLKPSYGKYVVLYEDDQDPTFPPMFVSFPEDMVAEVGDMVSLAPEVYGSDPLSYKWLRDGKDIYRYYKDISFSASKQTAGTYTCVAWNPYGEKRQDVKIDVTEPLTIATYAGTWKGAFLGTYHYLHIYSNGDAWFKYPRAADEGGGYVLKRGTVQLLLMDPYIVIWFEGERSRTAFCPTSATQGFGAMLMRQKWVKISDYP